MPIFICGKLLCLDDLGLEGLNKAPYGRTLRTSALSSGTGSLPA
jgi:hypothetical protein